MSGRIQNPLWKPTVWHWKTMHGKKRPVKKMKLVLEGRPHRGSTWPFDFRAATLKKVSNMVRPEGEETLAALAKNIHLASKKMLQRCKHKEKHKEVRNVATMRGLDLHVCRGIDKVVILKKPEALNRFLHLLAIKMCSGLEKYLVKSKSTFQTR